ncbi:MAG: hypothetical protein K2L42_04310 [Clostridia bacterium]|nr:hypothetical protein [Clostridia bacterium]
MKICAIDIGSNSVRLGMTAGGKTLYKIRKTTRLGENLARSGELTAEAIERTAQTVAHFAAKAKEEGAQKIYPFATAAVRSARNGQAFTARVQELCGLTVEVVSGETEAKIGLLGALGYKNGGMIDLGGASTEVTVQNNREKIFAKSVDIGTVRLNDLCGYDINKLENTIAEKLKDYGAFTADNYDMYGVSGTATTLAAVKQGLTEYDPNTVHGTILTADEVEAYARAMLALTKEQVLAKFPVTGRTADIIGGGALLLARLMQKLKIKQITVSESDNLEGFIILKEGKL